MGGTATRSYLPDHLSRLTDGSGLMDRDDMKNLGLGDVGQERAAAAPATVDAERVGRI